MAPATIKANAKRLERKATIKARIEELLQEPRQGGGGESGESKPKDFPAVSRTQARAREGSHRTAQSQVGPPGPRLTPLGSPRSPSPSAGPPSTPTRSRP
jgi:hypothetical protein